MEIEQIWAQFGARLQQWIGARVNDPQVAEELTQELLIKVHQNLASLQDRERLAAWLFRIARNVVNDHYRRKVRDPLQLPEEIGEGPLAESVEASAYEDLSPCVQPLIAQLPEKYRAVLQAVEIDGQSQKALAEQLGVSHSTVKSQTQRARQQLLKLLRRCCEFQIDEQGRLLDYQPHDGPCADDCGCP